MISGHVHLTATNESSAMCLIMFAACHAVSGFNLATVHHSCMVRQKLPVPTWALLGCNIPSKVSTELDCKPQALIASCKAHAAGKRLGPHIKGQYVVVCFQPECAGTDPCASERVRRVRERTSCTEAFVMRGAWNCSLRCYCHRRPCPLIGSPT